MAINFTNNLTNDWVAVKVANKSWEFYSGVDKTPPDIFSTFQYAPVNHSQWEAVNGIGTFSPVVDKPYSATLVDTTKLNLANVQWANVINIGQFSKDVGVAFVNNGDGGAATTIIGKINGVSLD